VPEIRGIVVDETGQPVSGAEVHVQPVDDPEQPIVGKVVSDSLGRFTLREQATWGVWIPIGDPLQSLVSVQAISGNRASDVQRVGGGVAQVRVFGLGRVDSFDLGSLVIADKGRE
jgi:hypothetical protein